MRTVLVTIALAGCGRVDFDPAPAGGHDEDADGVPDVVDVCPHLPGSQDDGDGDGVGDDCDPEPANSRQRLLLFATMQPGDQPFAIIAGTGTWTQEADAFRFVTTGNGNGVLSANLAFASARIAVGMDVLSIDGGPGVQHQLALGSNMGSALPRYFVQINQGPNRANATAAVTQFNGTYQDLAGQPVPGGFHTGAVFLQATIDALATPTSYAVDAGWPGEMYTASTMAAGYVPSTHLTFNVNNLTFDMRYVWVVAWD